ncbi:MAG: FAD-dependent oxidoreductase [Gammaproteobacteria bacterium]|nr:FAD-dependent oxidoreductase [Gammaproteobacteria bacterium]
MVHRRGNLDRRELLSATAGAAVLAATPRLLKARKRSKVIVIGAGLSGLGAALALEEAGLDVQVIEGRDRIGGRVLSHRNVPGNPESGGTSFAPGYARLVSAANDHGVELIDLTPIVPFFFQRELFLGGERIAPDAWVSHPRNPFPEPLKKLMPWAYLGTAAAKNPLTTNEAWLDPANSALDIPVSEWLKSIGWSDDAIHMAYDINPNWGDSARTVSALMVLSALKFQQTQQELAKGKAMGYTARDGNQAIPEAMARALERPVELRRNVVAIRSDRNGVEVRCADGTRYQAEHVVCSIPTAVLRNVAIEPALPAEQARAVRELGVQAISLVHAVPRRKFWEDDALSPNFVSDGLINMAVAERKGADPKEVTSLSLWLRGENARKLDRLDDAEATAAVVREFEKLRPAAKGQLEVLAYHSWMRDPFSLGDWAVWEPGQVSAFARIVGKAHGRMHFCGEHTAISNRGMEGALESSERVALEILDDA